MKNRIATILAVVMLAASCSAALAACGSGGGDNNTVTPTNTITSSTRPSMPTESMQTVAVEDAMTEINSYKKKLYESENGSAQYYYGGGIKNIYYFPQAEREGNVFLDTFSPATQITRQFGERAGRYCGIKNDRGTTGAFTMYGYYIDESKTDSTNPKLSYLNNEYHSNYIATGIQKDSQMFIYSSGKGKDMAGEEYVNDEKLVYYSDDEGLYENEKMDGNYLPLSTRVKSYARLSDVYDFNNIAFVLLRSYDYVMSNYDKTRLYNISYDDSYPGDFSIKDFSFTIKKSATKLYVSTKYSAVFETYSSENDGNTYTWDEEFEDEVVLLIDLSQPQSIDAGASGGKDVSGITLSNSWANIAYPNITSAQLTQAVKEGKTITIDVLGNGDVSGLELCWINDYIPVENGKLTIDGAAIKESIDNGSAHFRAITFVYLIDGNPHYYGEIKINYGETQN